MTRRRSRSPPAAPNRDPPLDARTDAADQDSLPPTARITPTCRRGLADQPGQTLNLLPPKPDDRRIPHRLAAPTCPRNHGSLGISPRRLPHQWPPDAVRSWQLTATMEL